MSATRALLRRQPFFAPRRAGQLRHSSATEKASNAASDASSKAKETASGFQSKASEGLSRVTSAAGPALSGAANRVGSAVGSVIGKMGGRTGRLVQAAQSAIPPTLYYSRVGLELGKLVFSGRSMAIPPLQSFQSYLQPLLTAARNPSTLVSTAASTTPESILNRARNVNGAQLAAAGIVTAEVLGFFTVGEMIGKFKVVGYRGESGHGH